METSETKLEDANPNQSGANAPDLKLWFICEVLPLEPSLMQFLRHSWHRKEDIPDLRQDIYVRVYEAAQKQIPRPAKPFVFAIARNLLIDRFRRERIIPIDGVTDLETLEVATDEPGPDRNAIARDALRRLQAALDRLPPRCREAVMLRQMDGLSRREIALRMGISEKTVKCHLNDGAGILIEILHGESIVSGAEP